MRSLFILIILFSFSVMSLSQSCLPEGIEFTTQAQIDSFQINYPNCTEIEGDVEIKNGITNLNGLNALTLIGGNLIFNFSMDLSSFNGLENLTSIGGNLGISHCHELTSCIGLNNLSSVGGGLGVFSNESLSSLDGIENLSSVGGDIQIGTEVWGMGGYGNPALTNIAALSNVDSINGFIEIAHNPSLTGLSGLENVDPATITDLSVYENASLSTCDIQSLCSYLNMPNGSVNIYNNSAGCNNPAEIANACGFTLSCLPFGNYYFMSQSEVDSFQSNYPVCTELEGNVRISGSDIANLYDLIAITSIAGTVEIKDNDILVTLTGLDSLNYIGGDLLFGEYGNGSYNYMLNSLQGLENLDSIGGGLYIEKCLSLQSLSGLDGLKSIGSHFLIGFANTSLTDLSSLSNLNSIGGGLYLGCWDGWNTTLTNLTGFENLDSIGGALHIVYMDALLDLSALSKLTTIGGQLYIWDNDALPSLTGLDNIDANSINSLTIVENQALSQCEVKSICDYLAAPGGSVSISENQTGCNSQQEVEDACETVHISELSFLSDVKLYPNPASKSVILRYDSYENSSILISLYSINGIEILPLFSKVSNKENSKVEIDCSNLPGGIYFIKLQTSKEIITKKLVIQ